MRSLAWCQLRALRGLVCKYVATLNFILCCGKGMSHVLYVLYGENTESRAEPAPRQQHAAQHDINFLKDIIDSWLLLWLIVFFICIIHLFICIFVYLYLFIVFVYYNFIHEYVLLKSFSVSSPPISSDFLHDHSLLISCLFLKLIFKPTESSQCSLYVHSIGMCFGPWLPAQWLYLCRSTFSLSQQLSVANGSSDRSRTS